MFASEEDFGRVTQIYKQTRKNGQFRKMLGSYTLLSLLYIFFFFCSFCLILGIIPIGHTNIFIVSRRYIFSFHFYHSDLIIA